jgi:DNA-binding transcriptional LysR family regulator
MPTSNINPGDIDYEWASIMQLPDLSRLRYFLAVAESLNFRGAADRLHVAQPAVSRAVQLLEAELGFKLLERTTRKVALTPAGAVLARDAGEALAQLQHALRKAGQVASGTAGEIIVCYSAQAASGPMPKIVVAFRSAFPDAQVGLYSLSSDEQVPALEAGRADLGFLLTAACREPLRHLPVARECFVLLVSAYDRLADRQSVRLSELANLPFVLGTPKRWLTFRSLINNACLNAGFLPNVVEEADDVPLLLQLISLRKGVTLYGAAAAPSLPSDIKAIPISDAHGTFELSIAWHASRQTPLMREFIAVAQTFVRP